MANTIQIIISAVDKTQNALKTSEAGLQRLATTAQIAGGVMTAAFTVPLALIAKSSISAASDLSESLNKVQVVFEDSGDAITDWSEKSAKAFGMSQQQALEAAGTYGNLFSAMGLGQKETADMSTSLVELAADLASFNNIDPSEALLKLRSGLVGEAEPLRTLGIQLSEARVQAKAMEMGLADSTGAISNQNKVLARYQIILDDSAKAQGDFARTANGFANSQRTLNAEWINAKAALGQALLPIMVDITHVLIGMLEKFNESPKAIKFLIVGLGGLLALAGPSLTMAGTVAQIALAVKGLGAAETIGGIGSLTTGLKGLAITTWAAVGPWIALAAAVAFFIKVIHDNWATFQKLGAIITYGVTGKLPDYAWNIKKGSGGALDVVNGPLANIGGAKMARGGSFIVPPGHSDDTFPVWTSSGEKVSVNPAGSSGGDIIIPLNYQPMFSTASKDELEAVIRPIIADAIRRKGKWA